MRLKFISEASDPYADTSDSGSGTRKSKGSNEVVDATRYLNKLRRQKEEEKSPEEKLSIALDRSRQSENLASAAYRKVNDLELKVDNGFSKVTDMLTRISSGEPLEDPEGGSIWDEDEVEPLDSSGSISGFDL
jgi:hypothetical protein